MYLFTAGRSSHPELKDGGALQVSLVKFQIDYYPYHLAMADRKHWAKYREGATPHGQWLQQSLNAFRSQFMDLIDSTRTQHSPLTRSQANVTGIIMIKRTKVVTDLSLAIFSVQNKLDLDGFLSYRWYINR